MDTATLEQYRNKLRDIRAELVDEMQSDANAVAEDVQPPGDVTSLPTHTADQDSEGIAERVALADLERNRVDEVDAALQRIDEGTFGRCDECGSEISRERLDALPYTPYCIDCARKHDEQAQRSERNT